MLLGGDELSHTQLGNNNAYCQDNEITWLSWEKTDDEFFNFVKKLICMTRIVLTYDISITYLIAIYLLSDWRRHPPQAAGVTATQVLRGPQQGRQRPEGYHVGSPRRPR